MNNVRLIMQFVTRIDFVNGNKPYRDYSFWRHLLLVCQLLSIRVSIFQASGPPNIDALLVCSSAHQTMNASVCALFNSTNLSDVIFGNSLISFQ